MMREGRGPLGDRSVCCFRLGNVRISSCDDSYIDTLMIKDEKELITDKGEKKEKVLKYVASILGKGNSFVLFPGC